MRCQAALVKDRKLLYDRCRSTLGDIESLDLDGNAVGISCEGAKRRHQDGEQSIVIKVVMGQFMSCSQVNDERRYYEPLYCGLIAITHWLGLFGDFQLSRHGLDEIERVYS